MTRHRQTEPDDNAWIRTLGLIPGQDDEPQSVEQAFAEEAEHYVRQVNAALGGSGFRLVLE